MVQRSERNQIGIKHKYDRRKQISTALPFSPAHSRRERAPRPTWSPVHCTWAYRSTCPGQLEVGQPASAAVQCGSFRTCHPPGMCRNRSGHRSDRTAGMWPTENYSIPTSLPIGKTCWTWRLCSSWRTLCLALAAKEKRRKNTTKTCVSICANNGSVGDDSSYERIGIWRPN